MKGTHFKVLYVDGQKFANLFWIHESHGQLRKDNLQSRDQSSSKLMYFIMNLNTKSLSPSGGPTNNLPSFIDGYFETKI
jgi:hypothetical protein